MTRFGSLHTTILKGLFPSGLSVESLKPILISLGWHIEEYKPGPPYQLTLTDSAGQRWRVEISPLPLKK